MQAGGTPQIIIVDEGVYGIASIINPRLTRPSAVSRPFNPAICTREECAIPTFILLPLDKNCGKCPIED
jgi:hypothetical protein